MLIADDLLPSELTALDVKRLVAICLARGGATSHVAILAAAMEIPMLVGLGSAIRDVADGTTGHRRCRRRHAARRHRPRRRSSKRKCGGRRAAHAAAPKAQAEAQAECRALDGTRIEVFANLGNLTDAAAAVANGAEGCGLLRTEFLFIDRETAPDEDEQLAAYQGIAAALGTRPLILRLMDVGGDKPLRYLPLPAEENPALGLRGVRTALAHPDCCAPSCAPRCGCSRLVACGCSSRWLPTSRKSSPCAASSTNSRRELGIDASGSHWAR